MIAHVSRENTHRHAPEWTCPYCGKSCNGTCGGWGGRKPETITITQRDGRWNWQRHTAGLIWTSRESYATELDAAIDAIEIARIYRAAVRLPFHLRAGVAAHYQSVGVARFRRDEDVADCRNEFERLGWTQAKSADGRVTKTAIAAGTTYRVEVYG